MSGDDDCDGLGDGVVVGSGDARRLLMEVENLVILKLEGCFWWYR